MPGFCWISSQSVKLERSEMARFEAEVAGFSVIYRLWKSTKKYGHRSCWKSNYHFLLTYSAFLILLSFKVWKISSLNYLNWLCQHREMLGIWKNNVSRNNERLLKMAIISQRGMMAYESALLLIAAIAWIINITSANTACIKQIKQTSTEPRHRETFSKHSHWEFF